MANLQGYELTVTGRALLAKAGTGACTLNFTKVKLGADETSLNDLINKTDLVGTNIKQIDIVGSKANEATFTIIATVTNSGMQNNFLIRQVGIFAKGVAATNPGTGVTPEDINETLFAVAYDTQPDIIPAESITPYTRQFNANMTVTNVEQCNVTLTPSGVVTVQVLNNHNDNSEAHGNLIKRIFGSASATMDSIKNKINEWSKEVCLPLSGGELTGDITANNVYANNNVLVFNNVAEMKASNKVKAGYTIKTLGFYQPGDGGGADYVITNDIGEDEVDEASIITLQNGLYAKLLIKDFINIKWFGAKIDDETDDSTAFNKAISFINNITKEFDTASRYDEHCKKAYTRYTLYIPSGIMKINSTLTIDPSIVKIKGDSTYIDATSISGYAIKITMPSSGDRTVYYNNHTCIEDITISGSQGTAGHYGILLGDKDTSNNISSTSFGASRCQFKNVSIEYFDRAIEYANHQYMDAWEDCSFFRCNSVIYVPNKLYDSGERISYRNCCFWGNKNVLDTHMMVHLVFENCSFDYNDQITKTDILWAELIGCHLESWFYNGKEYSHKPWVEHTAESVNDGKFMCFYMNGGSIYINGLTEQSGNKGLFHIMSPQYGIILKNVAFREDVGNLYQIVSGKGQYKINLLPCIWNGVPNKIADISNIYPVSDFTNRTNVDNIPEIFYKLNSNTNWEVITKDSTNPDRLRITHTSTGTAGIYILIPSKDFNLILLNFSFLFNGNIGSAKMYCTWEEGYLNKSNIFEYTKQYGYNKPLTIESNKYTTDKINYVRTQVTADYVDNSVNTYVRFKIWADNLTTGQSFDLSYFFLSGC